jgi:rRNA maturation endonuclease Nob1
MSAEHRRKCSICGREFSGGKAFCPVCMLRAAAAAGSESGEVGGG